MNNLLLEWVTFEKVSILVTLSFKLKKGSTFVKQTNAVHLSHFNHNGNDS